LQSDILRLINIKEEIPAYAGMTNGGGRNDKKEEQEWQTIGAGIASLRSQ